MSAASYTEVLQAAQKLPLDNQVKLCVLANSVLAPSRQKKLQALLEKNRNGTLSANEEMSLDQLLEEADQVALLKARAQYTLHLSNA